MYVAKKTKTMHMIPFTVSYNTNGKTWVNRFLYGHKQLYHGFPNTLFPWLFVQILLHYAY